MSLRRAACVVTAAEDFLRSGLAVVLRRLAGETSIAAATLLIAGGVDSLPRCSLHVSIAVTGTTVSEAHTFITLSPGSTMTSWHWSCSCECQLGSSVCR
jgi:hypothetical protein